MMEGFFQSTTQRIVHHLQSRPNFCIASDSSRFYNLKESLIANVRLYTYLLPSEWSNSSMLGRLKNTAGVFSPFDKMKRSDFVCYFFANFGIGGRGAAILPSCLRIIGYIQHPGSLVVSTFIFLGRNCSRHLLSIKYIDEYYCY